MKQYKKSSQVSSLREALGAFASRVLLVFSLFFIFTNRIIKGIQTRICAFYYDHVYHRLRGARALCSHVRAHRVQSLSLIMTFVLLIPMASILRPAVAVKADGRVLGYVKDESEVAAAFREIERESTAILGEPFHIDADISYEVAVTSPENLLEKQELNSAIAESANNIETLSVVKVNGDAVAAVNDAAQAESALVKMEDTYRGDDADAEVTLLDHVAVETMQAPTQLLTSEDALLETLTETETPAEVIEATEDDTMTSIAQTHGMLVDDLLALNPDIVPEKLVPGTEVVLAPTKPLVSVSVKKTIDYTETIPFDTITQQNAELAQDKVQVLQQGTPGQASIQAEVVLVNGEEQERTILSRTVLSDATNKIVTVGTKKMGIGTGSLRRPVAGGTVTSGFKWRWGRLHKGVDIAVPTGTPVMAADDGKVIVSGYSKSGYGNYVIINHNNGTKTLYGHNSTLKVSVGDIVEKGQTIAFSGNTGRSTGPHCHFEVIINDNNVDPMKYIS